MGFGVSVSEQLLGNYFWAAFAFCSLLLTGHYIFDIMSFINICSKRLKIPSAMDGPGNASPKELPLGQDPIMIKEYESLSKLLLEFTGICSINKAWVYPSGTGLTSIAFFQVKSMDASFVT